MAQSTRSGLLASGDGLSALAISRHGFRTSTSRGGSECQLTPPTPHPWRFPGAAPAGYCGPAPAAPPARPPRPSRGRRGCRPPCQGPPPGTGRSGGRAGGGSGRAPPPAQGSGFFLKNRGGGVGGQHHQNRPQQGCMGRLGEAGVRSTGKKSFWHLLTEYPPGCG